MVRKVSWVLAWWESETYYHVFNVIAKMIMTSSWFIISQSLINLYIIHTYYVFIYIYIYVFSNMHCGDWGLSFIWILPKLLRCCPALMNLRPCRDRWWVPGMTSPNVLEAISWWFTLPETSSKTPLKLGRAPETIVFQPSICRGFCY